MEIWKPVKGYEGLYEVSDKGNVKSLERLVKRKNGVNFMTKTRILKPIAVGKYHGVQLCDDGKHKKYYIHRLVASHFIERTRKEATAVNHIDGNRFNNAKENLEWVTHAENNKHAASIGLTNIFGEDNPVCKYSDKTVQEIRDLYDNNVMRQFEISNLYGVSRMQVHRIVKRKLRIRKGGEVLSL